jgi:uncharacterized protein YbjQ (UPF0145 family)
MILTTTADIPGSEIAEVIGLVQGTSVRASDLGMDVGGFMQNLVGGEMSMYTKLMAEVREQSLDRMREEARAQGADAIVGVRFVSSEISRGAAELLVYGTAVRLASPH